MPQPTTPHAQTSFFFLTHILSLIFSPSKSSISLLLLLHLLLSFYTNIVAKICHQPFKDHTFWSLKTRSKHSNLHFLKKNTKAFTFSFLKLPPPSPWRSHLHLLFSFKKAQIHTLGSDPLLFLFVVQESLKLYFSP